MCLFLLFLSCPIYDVILSTTLYNCYLHYTSIVSLKIDNFRYHLSRFPQVTCISLHVAKGNNNQRTSNMQLYFSISSDRINSENERRDIMRVQNYTKKKNISPQRLIMTRDLNAKDRDLYF